MAKNEFYSFDYTMSIYLTAPYGAFTAESLHSMCRDAAVLLLLLLLLSGYGCDAIRILAVARDLLWISAVRRVMPKISS